MEKAYRILVFGKAGCKKCEILNQRLDTLLGKPEWEQFEKLYCDVETVDGLVAFCNTECVNPQRVPALAVMKRSDQTGAYELMPNPAPGGEDRVCGQSRLYTHLGLQTDYSGAGRGLLTPKMIQSVLKQAAALA